MGQELERRDSIGSEPIIEILGEIWHSTLEACQGLRDDQWDLVTQCPGWSVKDQISHLVGTERWLLGETQPPGPSSEYAHVKNSLGSFNERWIEARRSEPGNAVLKEFEEVTSGRLAQLRSFAPDRFDEVGPSPIGEVPYRVFMEVRAFDSWVHEQDVRLAIEKKGGRGGRGEEITLRRVRDSLGYVMGRKVVPQEGAKVFFDVSGPLPLSLNVAMVDGRGVVQEGEPRDPTATVALPADVFWRLGCGRIRALDAVSSGDVGISGDAQLAKKLLAEMAFVP